MAVLKINGLSKSFGIKTVFENVSFEVRSGERIGLVGANGAGKTCLLYTSISWLVTQYGDKINSAINSVMMKEGAGTNYATKVVPIVSLGNKQYIGAAQVIGPSKQVEKVKAVGQIQIAWNLSLIHI